MRPQVDDIFAALILSLVMLRRLEVRTTSREQNPHVSAEQFDAWKRLALRAYDQAAVASAGKVALNMAWLYFGLQAPSIFPAMSRETQALMLTLGGLTIFLVWMVLLVWAWKIGTDARHRRLSLGIRLRREVRPA